MIDNKRGVYIGACCAAGVNPADGGGFGVGRGGDNSGGALSINMLQQGTLGV